MSEKVPAKPAAVPLLLEIARARRTREFYSNDHPTLSDALSRLTRMWRRALSGVDEIELQLEDRGFSLMGASGLTGPGIEEFAAELTTRGIRRLRFGSEFEPAEMAILVDALAASPTEAGDVEQYLERSGVRNITTTSRSFRELHEQGAPSAPQDLGSAKAAEGVRPEDDETPTATDGLTTGDETPTPLATPTQIVRAEDPVEDGPHLLRLLAELEGCEDLGTYKELSDRIQECSGLLLASRNFFDAYRATLVFTRHSGDLRGHPSEIRDEARARLQLLLESDEFLGFVIELAAAGEGLTCVQATQVVVTCGAPVVSSLLDLHIMADDATSRAAASVLIAMGDEALSGIAEELSSPTLERARRAARLLGDLQHPRAVEHLDRAFRSDHNPGIRLQAARALVHIGSERAIDSLLAALEADVECAELAARCLGQARDPRVPRALVATIDEHSGHPDAVRRQAIQSLGKLGGDEALDALRTLLERRSLLKRKRVRSLRIAAAQAIARIGSGSAREALEANTGQGDTAVRRACRSALKQLAHASGSRASA
jgi:thioredoxin-like negative regulator of GroEL